MRIDVLIENSTHDHLLSEHGLSFLIHFNNKVYLLDAGKTGAFMDNANAMHIDLSKVDKCILSHGHYDHSDGFIRFLDVYPNQKIYASENVFEDYYSTSNNELHYIGLDERLKDKKYNFHLIHEVTCIDEGVYLVPHHALKYTINKNLYKKVNGEYILDDFAHELSLVFEKDDELVVLNSCSHVGMQSVLDDLSRVFADKKVKVYLGGLHMKGRNQGKEICVYTDEQIKEICEVIYRNNIHVYTGHCTGDIAFAKLKEQCDDLIHKLYSGLSIEI